MLQPNPKSIDTNPIVSKPKAITQIKQEKDAKLDTPPENKKPAIKFALTQEDLEAEIEILVRGWPQQIGEFYRK